MAGSVLSRAHPLLQNSLELSHDWLEDVGTEGTRVAVEICSIRLTARTFAKHALSKTQAAAVIVPGRAVVPSIQIRPLCPKDQNVFLSEQQACVLMATIHPGSTSVDFQLGELK